MFMNCLMSTVCCSWYLRESHQRRKYTRVAVEGAHQSERIMVYSSSYACTSTGG